VSIAIVLQNVPFILVTYSGCSRQQTHSLCVGMVAHLSQVHHRAFSNRSFNSTWLLSPVESLARSGFKSSHTKAQKNKHTLGRNDVMDMRPGLRDPFGMAAPSVELFTSFSLELHPLQKRKQRWVAQLNVNFFIDDGKKYTVFGVTFSFKNIKCFVVMVKWNTWFWYLICVLNNTIKFYRTQPARKDFMP